MTDNLKKSDKVVIMIVGFASEDTLDYFQDTQLLTRWDSSIFQIIGLNEKSGIKRHSCVWQESITKKGLEKCRFMPVGLIS